MPIADAREEDVLPFYYFVVAFSVAHVFAGSALFVRQRTKFPVVGHNAYFSIVFVMFITGGLIAAAFQGAEAAETCSVAMATVFLVFLPGVNLITAQAIRLWYEYNLADERMQTADGHAEDGGQAPVGWFARNRRVFQAKVVFACAMAISIVEAAVGVGIIASLEENGFADEVQCVELLAIVGVAAVFCVVVSAAFVYLFLVKFRHKRDGYGIKRVLQWVGALVFVCSPAIVLIWVWEAVSDLPYYAAAIRVLFHFVFLNLLAVVTLDWPVYLSFFESAQHGMSSISQPPDNEEIGDDGEQMQEVLNLASAGRGSAAGIEILRHGAGTGAPEQLEASSSPAKTPEDTPEVFSSQTLALTLADVLLNPAYAAQMASFARHLIGEFNVEGLLFYLRVLNFNKFVRADRVSANSDPKQNLATEVNDTEATAKENSEDSQFSSSSSASSGGDHSIVVKSAGEGGEDDEFSVEVAWKALLVYFEFLADGSPGQVNIGHRVRVSITTELEESVVDFRQLPPTVAADDVQLKRPLDTKIFDKAQQNVFLMIERDPFVRWRKAIREQIADVDNAKA